MAQDSKRGLFRSMFSTKKKTEEEIQAEKESRRRLEDRIREVLLVSEPTQFEPASESKRDTFDTAEILPVPLFPSAPSAPAAEPEYAFMYLSPDKEALRKPPAAARYMQSLEPAQASQGR